ncbi:MAG: MBL fold metallo-hydrolase [Candidatus Natronoplasma sp.]
MDVTLLGTSGGIPLPGRAQSGVLVETSEKNILLDCGMGIPLRLSEVGVKAEDIDIICLTHGHLDHIQDLPSLTKASWLSSKEAEYKIIMPHHLKKKLIDFWKVLGEYERTELEFEILKPGHNYNNEIDLNAFKTDHTDISQGYEIFEEGKKLVYTGDTSPCERVREKSESADILIHELSNIEKTDHHTDPASLISELSVVDIGELIITHFYPPVEEKARELAADIEKKTGIPTTVGEDLMQFSI